MDLEMVIMLRVGRGTTRGVCMAGKVTKTPSYQLKVVLQDASPEVWRRVVVPGHWHLGQLHLVLQVAMGWTNSHLHEFEADGVRYGEPDLDSGAEVRREATSRVHEVLPAVGARMLYTYDFGDDWRHELIVEQVGEPVQQASCLAGERACPPEDCGGTWGYAEMLEAVSDPAHPEHETYAEWLAEDFDAEAFDPAVANRVLRRVS
jgi:hypothetical protein